MARLSSDDYLEHLRSDSGRFRAVLAACDPAAPVPACPGWEAADLLWHLAEVQWFWATTIRSRPTPADEDAPGPDRPATYDGLLAAFDEHSAALIAALETADPAEPAWSWSADQTVGFTFRRQAQEALIHRLDAEQTAGVVTALDPALAADGVDEALDVMLGGTPSWGAFTALPHYVRVDIAERNESIWVQLGRFVGTDPESGTSYDVDDIEVVPDHGGEPDVVVTGSAAALDAWLWRRGDDTEIAVAGDRAVYDLFRACTNQAID